jgi:predicted DNA-binding transcriptional regulator YafY
MRADRLLSLMMVLQTRGSGNVTALELARELEVSERTIYRDVEALSLAGVPVYADRGPGGGIRLLEEYRTNLTGLTADETRALFMLSIPSPLLQLGVGQELKAALLKLSAALPEARRREQQAARQRIHLDARWWGQAQGPGPHLAAVQQALWQDKRLKIVTRMFFGSLVEQTVEPLGLAAKAGEWYLVARVGEGQRVFRVNDLVSAEALGEPFHRPDEFDLPSFWEAHVRQVESDHGLFEVRLRISPGLARELPWRIGGQALEALERASPPDEKGWREVELRFDRHEQARDKVLTFGSAAEVLEPLALRRSLADAARQVLSVYPGPPGSV